MNFELNEAQRQFDESIRRFAENELAADATNRATSSDYPWDIAERMSAIGLMGITLPEADGGQGGTIVDAILAIQAVADSCPKSADIVQAGNFGAIRTFAENASDEQKQRFLPELLSGKCVMAIGMTEPDAGSAVTDLTTRATQTESGYRISGSKLFSTHSAIASVFLVYVRFEPGIDGIGSVLIERNTTGLEFGPASSFMNGESWSPIYFNDCEIPAENLLLGSGGFKKQISGFNIERLGNAARSLAVGRFAFNLALDHAQTRRQFGKTLNEFQGLQWQFAEIATEIESAQLLLFKAAMEADTDRATALSTAMAKLSCNQAGYKAADFALQVFGASGFSSDHIAQYCYRRTRGWRIAGGTTEMLKNRIAEGLFQRRFSQRG